MYKQLVIIKIKYEYIKIINALSKQNKEELFFILKHDLLNTESSEKLFEVSINNTLKTNSVFRLFQERYKTVVSVYCFNE